MSGGGFGISSIAWPGAALDEALAMLPGLGCDAVEIAPLNVFGRWDDLAAEARRLRGRIGAHGLTCSAMQGILYGVPGVELFASAESRTRLLHHLEKVAALAGILGAGSCVFGAPRQRDPGDMPAAEAWQIAADLLRRAGPVFAAEGSCLAFEANARRYACRFVTTTAEAARLVADVNTPGIRLQIDTGTLFLEAEPPEVLALAVKLASHAHVSEPDLAPLGREDHAPIAAALRRYSYAGSLSVEMKETPDWRDHVPAALRFARATYR